MIKKLITGNKNTTDLADLGIPNTNEIIRSYCLKNQANKSKIQKIKAIILEYRKMASVISSYHWLLFFKEKKSFSDFRDIKELHTHNSAQKALLSERYKQTCQSQVVGTLKSYIANIQNRFTDMVYNSATEFSSEIKHQLFYINRSQQWFSNDVVMVLGGKDKKEIGINKETILLARKIFKRLTRNKPRFSNYNMILDEKVATVFKKNDMGAKKFDYWIKFSTLEKGKPIYVPLQTNDFFDSKDGILKKAIQVNLDRKNGNISVRLIKQLTPEIIQQTSNALGIDIGLVNLIATEHGDLMGVQLMKWLKKYDRIITVLQGNLMRQGIKPNTNPRFKELNRKVKQGMKNEICRIINNLVKQYRPKEIALESLNFQQSNIGRKNNRLLHRFGQRIISDKLASVSQEQNITIRYVPSPYTSIGCTSCYYVANSNRKERSLFHCKCCGYKCHADVAGARNVSSRSSTEFTLNLTKKEILQILYSKHNKWTAARRKNAAYSSAKDLVAGLSYGSSITKVSKISGCDIAVAKNESSS